MSLEQAIHERWRESSGLCGLLPVERFTTGRSPGGPTPYATMQTAGRRPVLPTNAGNMATENAVEIRLWHDDFDTGEQIVEYIQSLFHHAAFALPDASATVRMRELRTSAEQEKDGLWQWKIELQALVCRLLTT